MTEATWQLLLSSAEACRRVVERLFQRVAGSTASFEQTPQPPDQAILSWFSRERRLEIVVRWGTGGSVFDWSYIDHLGPVAEEGSAQDPFELAHQIKRLLGLVAEP